MQTNNDSWLSGNPYEQFMGRWSSLIAQEFLRWLAVPPARKWLDVGCGTGVLARLILQHYQPQHVVGVDPSNDFIAYAKRSINHPSVQLTVGLAQSLDIPSNSMDAVVSGLVLNFIPQPEEAVTEMIRVAKPGGQIGIFLWDYADGMEMLRFFWDAAIELDDDARELDEGVRFPICREGQLEALAQSSRLRNVEAVPIDVTTVFRNFDAYWQPFLGNAGPAPSYVMGLSLDARQELETRLRQALPVNEDGSISLNARAWAVKGTA